MPEEEFSHVCDTGIGYGAVSLWVGCIFVYYLSDKVSKLRCNILRALCGVYLRILFK